MREIKIQVWDTVKKEMSMGMPLVMLAGYLTAIHPNLGNEVYREFTGLLDKNGKEIYEGDVVVHANVGKKGVVTWKHSQWMVMQGKITGHDIVYNCHHPEDGYNCYFLEIIGNIYENEDLLKD